MPIPSAIAPSPSSGVPAGTTTVSAPWPWRTAALLRRRVGSAAAFDDDRSAGGLSHAARSAAISSAVSLGPSSFACPRRRLPARWRLDEVTTAASARTTVSRSVSPRARDREVPVRQAVVADQRAGAPGDALERVGRPLECRPPAAVAARQQGRAIRRARRRQSRQREQSCAWVSSLMRGCHCRAPALREREHVVALRFDPAGLR